ncbi:MAG: DMT family transporter [Peptococcaceae bacterium]|nr:DMT family transporter [Peptococcaceae bacterium]
MPVRNAFPVAAALFVAVIFGFSFVFTKDILIYLDPFQLLGLRFALAALAMTLLAAFRLIRLNLQPSSLPALLKVAVWQPVLYFVFETYGVKLTSASESGVVIALVPLAATVLSVFMLGEKITPAQGVCVCAAVAGVAIMALGKTTADAGGRFDHLLGVLMLFGAVMAGAFYSIFSRRAAASFAPAEITFVMMWLGALVFNAIGLTQSFLAGRLDGYAVSLQLPPVIGGLLYLGLLSSVAAFFLLNYALSRMTASRTAVFLNLIPLVSLAAGVFFYGERLGPRQLAGCFLVLLGVWGTNYFAGKPSGVGRACR